MSSCILYSSPTVTLLDIPHSIELAQILSSSTSSTSTTPSQTSRRRLLSQAPLEHPHPSLSPRSAKAKAAAAATRPSLDDLILQKHLHFALDELRERYVGLWCLDRVMVEDEGGDGDGMGRSKKRKFEGLDADAGSVLVSDPVLPLEPPEEEEIGEHDVVLPDTCRYLHFHNPNPRSLHAIFGSSSTRYDKAKAKATIPPHSTILQGSISSTLHVFKNTAPVFPIITLDPPWPNRSARRKGAYPTSRSTSTATSHGPSSIHALLSSLPLHSHLATEGLIAIWITNSASCREIVLGAGGLFEDWGVRLVEEWVWLKVTSAGLPVCELREGGRKPFEVLLVGRRGGTATGGGDGGEGVGVVRRRVLVGVPDLHSRKPNLRVLLEGFVGKRDGEYEGLEIFARNLTAGWWGWGNEALKFQTEEHWVEP